MVNKSFIVFNAVVYYRFLYIISLFLFNVCFISFYGHHLLTPCPNHWIAACQLAWFSSLS